MFTGSRARGADGLPVLGKGKQIALDVARGLAFLHSQHVVHLDLKSPNGACVHSSIRSLASHYMCYSAACLHPGLLVGNFSSAC